MIYQNHVIDPTYFYDAIEEFAFNYVIYVVTGKTLNEDGKYTYSFMKQIIRGSLQSQGNSVEQAKEGNTNPVRYNFYCKSLYRIDIGDVIEYKGKYLRVISTRDYDEFGCRSAELEMIQLTAYRDLAAYIKYLNGVELV